MTEKQIKEEILRYLQDQSYNYAVLIDGEWGSGKTYFVTGKLTDSINELENASEKPRKVKYVSLYGCKNLEDIQENVAWSFAEDARKCVKEKAQWEGIGDRISSNILLSSKKIGHAILKKYLPGTSVYQITSDWLNMASFIFIFDDLERCECPINEVFGFLNDLVEHEKTKVIIIANEKEISGIAEAKHLEMQYLLAVNDRIDWPKEERSDFLRRGAPSNGKVSLTEMEQRRKLLFPVRENNGDYKKIREKLIGVTLRYEPDVEGIITEIIKTIKSDDVRELLLDRTAEFKSTMKAHRHCNLRTFQFFLSKICYLLERAKEINIDDDYKDIIIRQIIAETFSCSVRFKSNWHPPKNSYEWFKIEKEEMLQCIKQYVETGSFSTEEYRKDIDTLQEFLKANISNDDPCNVLSRTYYIHTQEWCEDMMEDILSKLKANKYPISFYQKILITILEMIHLGFNVEYMDRTKKYMLENISHMGETHEIVLDLWHVEDKHFKQEINEIVFNINEAIKTRSQVAGRESVEKILDCEDWLDRLEKYINPNNGQYAQDVSVFGKASSSKWICVLDRATPEDIDDFRHWLGDLYPRDVKRSSYVEDKEVIKEIIQSLKELNSKDLIKKACIGWLQSQFETIVDFQEQFIKEV